MITVEKTMRKAQKSNAIPKKKKIKPIATWVKVLMGIGIGYVAYSFLKKDKSKENDLSGINSV